MAEHEIYDFHDGGGMVAAAKHENGGGWVAKTAKVEKSVFVAEHAQVSGNARVYGDAQVSGDAWVSGNAHVTSSLCSKFSFTKTVEVKLWAEIEAEFEKRRDALTVEREHDKK